MISSDVHFIFLDSLRSDFLWFVCPRDMTRLASLCRTASAEVSKHQSWRQHVLCKFGGDFLDSGLASSGKWFRLYVELSRIHRGLGSIDCESQPTDINVSSSCYHVDVDAPSDDTLRW